MAGKIKMMLDKIIQQRSGGNASIVETTKAKLMLKGINVDKYTATSADDPVLIEKVTAIAREFNVQI